MPVFRSPQNPVIQPQDVRPSRPDFEVVGVFNAGAARRKDQYVLLLRVAERPVSRNPSVVATAVYDVTTGAIVTREFAKDDPKNDLSDPRLIVRPDGTYLTSISHLRLARSTDGVNFEIEQGPALEAGNDYESFGIEDSRITLVDEIYYITYVAVSPLGVTTCLASTKDFKSFDRHGVVFCPENKDVVLFPERIAGRYYSLHRPLSPLFKKNDVWLAQSPDLLCWGDHRWIMGPRPGLWDEKKVGAGAPPFKTEHGWLEIYHGADHNDRYCLGAVLLDSENPTEVIARANEPILEPQAECEREGFFGGVVFTCGALLEEGTVKIYYGAADTYICYAEIALADIIEALNL